jgi:hypothetical protein
VIDILLNHDAVPVGTFVDGSVTWRSDRRVHRVIASAEWRTRGKGNPAWGLGRSLIVTPAATARHGEFHFHLMIPHGGPVSYDGTLIVIEWFLAVRLDQSGLDETATKVFRVQARRLATAAIETRG